MNVHKVSTQIGDRELTIETGKLAKQADGSVIVTYGETVVLVTACAAKQPREGLDFFPLTVDYRENFYAAGKIPGGFFKREGKPSEREVLTSRLNLAIAAMEDGICMVECGASEVSEEVMVEALNFGHEAIKQIIGIQKQLYALVKPKKMTVVADVIDEAVAKQVEKALRSDL